MDARESHALARARGHAGGATHAPALARPVPRRLEAVAHLLRPDCVLDGVIWTFLQPSPPEAVEHACGQSGQQGGQHAAQSAAGTHTALHPLTWPTQLTEHGPGCSRARLEAVTSKSLLKRWKLLPISTKTIE